MRILDSVRAAIFVGSIAAAGVAHALGSTWEKIDGAKTATITVDSNSSRSYRYQSTGFLWNANTLNPITTAVDSVYMRLNTALYAEVLSALQNIPEYRSHYVSVDGPISLSLQPDGGSYAKLVSFTGPVAKATVDFSAQKFGISVNCRVVVTSGSISASEGRLDLSSGALSGLRLSVATPNHTENCSSSLGWLPIVGTLIDGFATSQVSSYVDKMLQSLALENVALSPLHFLGLDTVLPNVSWPSGPLADAAGFIKDNLWSAFQTGGVSIWIGQAPSPGAYVSSDRLRFSFTSMGRGISLVVNEYASYRLNSNPCSPACIPT